MRKLFGWSGRYERVEVVGEPDAWDRYAGGGLRGPHDG